MIVAYLYIQDMKFGSTLGDVPLQLVKRLEPMGRHPGNACIRAVDPQDPTQR